VVISLYYILLRWVK